MNENRSVLMEGRNPFWNPKWCSIPTRPFTMNHNENQLMRQNDEGIIIRDYIKYIPIRMY
jgi:hypothetical protein